MLYAVVFFTLSTAALSVGCYYVFDLYFSSKKISKVVSIMLGIIFFLVTSLIAWFNGGAYMACILLK
jgi:hypothetical protein